MIDVFRADDDVEEIEVFRADDDVEFDFAVFRADDDDIDGEFAAVRDKLEELGINIQGKEIEVTIEDLEEGLKRVECWLLGEGDLLLSVRLYMEGDKFHDDYTIKVLSADSAAIEQIIKFWNTVDLMTVTE